MSNTSTRVERAQKPRKCPECGQAPLASILYGMPAFDEELERKMNCPRPCSRDRAEPRNSPGHLHRLRRRWGSRHLQRPRPQASKPNRAASNGIDPPPAKGSSAGGSFPSACFSISSRALAYTSGRSCSFFCISLRTMSKSRSRSAFCVSSVGNFSGCDDGSSTTDANNTVRAVGSGSRAHQS